MNRLSQRILALALLCGAAPIMAPIPHAVAVDHMLIVGAASRDGYDAETQIGLVAGDYTDNTATTNTTKLNLALAAMHASGDFTFANGTTGPVLKPIVFSAKEFFFKGVIKTAKKIGGAMIGMGARTYLVTEAEYSSGASIGGAATRLTRIDGENDGPVILLRGTGFTLAGLDIRGSRYTGVDIYTKSRSCIEIESRNAPGTGNHIIQAVNFYTADNGVRFPGGYWDDADTYCLDVDLNPLQAHADELTLAASQVQQVDTFLLCECEQTVNCSVRDINITGSSVAVPLTVFNFRLGGKLIADNIGLNCMTVTLLKHGDLGISANVNRFEITNVNWDNVDYLGTVTSTSIVGNGATVTATHAQSAYYLPANPEYWYPVGTLIYIYGSNIANYNGWHTITARTATTVSWASTETGTHTGTATILGQAGQRCTLLNYSYTNSNVGAWMQPLDVRVTGHFANFYGSYDRTKLVQFGTGLGSSVPIPHFDRLLFDVTDLPPIDADLTTPMFARRGRWLYPLQSYFAASMASSNLVIASGAITVTEEVHVVDTEGAAASDTLSTISGGVMNQTLVLSAANSARTVIVDEADNVKLNGGSFSLDNVEDELVLRCRGSYWSEISRSDNGS